MAMNTKFESSSNRYGLGSIVLLAVGDSRLQ